MIDEYTRLSLLYDFYGALLTKRQQEVMTLYHEENFSLTEIAEEFGISRQGVHDTFKTAHDSLEAYENKLHLVAKFNQSDECIRKIDVIIEEVLNNNKDNKELLKSLNKVKEIIDNLNE